ncbi:reverse transcriptase, partial [Tanacetum coccineum]
LCGPDGVLSIEPEAIIGRRLGKLNNKVVLYVLVKWVNQTEEEATWELYTDLLHRLCLAVGTFRNVKRQAVNILDKKLVWQHLNKHLNIV